MEAFWGLLIHFPLAFPVHTHTHTHPYSTEVQILKQVYTCVWKCSGVYLQSLESRTPPWPLSIPLRLLLSAIKLHHAIPSEHLCFLGNTTHSVRSCQHSRSSVTWLPTKCRVL